jgi:D-alanyl-D-alanine carboxypeptidase
MMPTPPPVRRLQIMLDDYVDNLGAVGVLVGIDVPGLDRVRVTSGEREREGEKLGLAHLFQIGSQTKTFVALAILLLCRDGVLDLDDPASRHIALPIDDRVTLRHLIMNTSGVPEYLGLVQSASTDRMKSADLVGPALQKGLLFAPGEQFDYSNTGWVIAALVLDTKVPGGYAGFVRERIFAPLGMTDSYVGSGYPPERLAHAYLKGPEGHVVTAAEGFSLSWAYGAGDIISSCDDMLDFFRALSRPGNTLGVTLEDMTADWAEPAKRPIHPASLGGAYAFGLERRYWGGLEVWGHPGRTPAYGASTWFAPSNGVIVTTAFMYVEDATEPPQLAAQRYNPPLLFTEALTTAHALHDAISARLPIAPEFAETK